MRKENEDPEEHWETIDSAQLPHMEEARDQDEVEQGEAVTRRAFEGDVLVNGGVGPQPDEHRGNALGGFEYSERERKEQPTSEGSTDGNNRANSAKR